MAAIPRCAELASRCARFPPAMRRRFVPSMRQRIDVAGLYADALAAMPETIDGQPPLPMPEVCTVTLDELLSDDP